MLVVSLVSGILIIELFSTDWSPLFNSDKLFIEDFLRVDLDKSSIAVICDTTTIITL